MKISCFSFSGLPLQSFLFAGLLLGFGHFSAKSAIMSPIQVTGFNSDLVVEKGASGPPYASSAVELNPGENMAFYQAGLAGKSYGLPVDGLFTSALGDGTTFQFQSYSAYNAMVMNSGRPAGSLVLAVPQTFKRIALVAHSASGGGSGTMTLNFSDGSRYDASYNAPDWFNNTGYALAGFERMDITSGATQGAPDNPRFYQTTLELEAILGSSNRPLVSITFNQVPSTGATAVYAVSGEVSPPTVAQILSDPSSTNVFEGDASAFRAVVGGSPTPGVQWLRNGSPIPGATGASYVIPAAPLAWGGSNFRLVATNLVGGVGTSVTSSPAILSVTADQTAPTLVRAYTAGLTEVRVVFSEAISLASATNSANYSLRGALGLVPISVLNSGGVSSNVTLSVPMLADGSNYLLSVTGLRDGSVAGNMISPGASCSFTASSFIAADVGQSGLPGSSTLAAGGVNLTGSGVDIGKGEDQYFFSYQAKSGDFDVKVRLESLTLSDAWSQAGLVVREDLLAGSRMAAVMATPTISGCFFRSRSVSNTVPAVSGSFPVNYPATWLRLRRVGSVLSGYAGFDGVRWTSLGSMNATLPPTLFLGFAVSSQESLSSVTAAFRDYQPVTNAVLMDFQSRERPGQTTTRGPLAFSEIMYHPTNSSLEFVELLNTRDEPFDVGGWTLGGSIAYLFPMGTTIPGGGILVVAKDPPALEAAYGLSGVHGPYSNSLPNSQGTLRLVNGIGGVFLDIQYDSEMPWPVAADGGGHSLVSSRPSLGDGNPGAWVASESVGGSPGRLDPVNVDPLQAVRINEYLAHTDPPDYDYIELYNHGNQPVDISGCSLSDSPDTNRFIIPSGTIIPPKGFVWFSETNMNFALSAAGETVWFKNRTGSRVLDVVRFGGQENGIASGRFPDGADEIYRLQAKTPGQPNAPILVHDIAINEIMYHPISGMDDDQYVELYNRGRSPIRLDGWALGGGISFACPTNTVIQADGYLVVARLASRLLTNYPGLNAANTIGNFSGKLSGAGERVVLTMPDTITSTNSAGVVKTTTIAIAVDEVTYGTGGRWPRWADGGGSSLELADVRANHRLPTSWADSDESRKAPWSIVRATGTVDNGSTTADQLQLLLMGPGECLVDNVQVLLPSGSNLVTNPGFESNATGWTAEGTMSGSARDTTEGYGSLRSYHIRAVERGDNQLNRVRTGLSSTLSSGTTNVTLQAAARWIKGSPNLLLRLRGNWLECAGTLALPANPGTPGARNSSWTNNTPPAITQVRHQPVLPQSGAPITVTAMVQDPDGVAAATLCYRLDPGTTYTEVAMTDDGAGSDLIQGDGVFSGQIPAQIAGAMLAFYVRATDRFLPAVSARFPSDAPTRECLVRVGEVQPSGSYPVYRIWMTQATLNSWRTRKQLDNNPLDVTFVLDDSRVVYNARALYAGSPYIAPGYSSPTVGRCGYSLMFPEDDLFLGTTDLVLDWPGGHGNESTAMQEQLGYWVADQLRLAYSDRHVIRLHVNGVTDDARQAVFEAVQQPAADYVRQWSDGHTSGDFFKVDRAFEFSDAGGLIADPQPRLQNFTTTGGLKKREKYRWNFMFRGGAGPRDYTNVFALVDALDAAKPEPYTSGVGGLADTEQWMRIFAVSHLINNFDAYGHEIGKNMYAWRPDGGKWQFFLFDLDWLMLAANNHGYTASSGPLFNSEDPVIGYMFGFPPFSRAYWRTLADGVAGPFAPARYNPVMDAKYKSLVANGIKWCDGQVLTAPTLVKTWFSERRAFMLAQLATVASPFKVNSAIGVSNGLAVITGVAPVDVAMVSINGQPWDVTWTTVSNFTALVPLRAGSNSFAVTGLDGLGQMVSGASNLVSASYAVTPPSPVGNIVINEIMHHPAQFDGGYVELYNISTNTAFDLSGFQVNGLGYTFPGGSVIQPGGFMVLAESRLGAGIAYGPGLRIAGEYGGVLQPDGETLSLIKPGLVPEQDLVVDRVRYEAAAPWVATTAGTSLQLAAPAQDNSRSANWGAGRTNVLVGPQWGYFWTNVTPASSRLYLYMTNAGDFYMDDLKLVSGMVPETGRNLMTNGDFEAVLAGSWSLTGSFVGSALSTAVKHTGNSSFHVVATGAGTGSGNAIYQDIIPALTNGGAYTLSFWYLQNTNGPVVARFSGNTTASGVVGQTPLQLAPAAVSTPGSANSVRYNLPAFPTLWLNEVQPVNITGPVDNFGIHEPWLELYNPGTNSLSLAGYFLGTNYSSPPLWAFPPQTSIAPGEFLTVWADGQPEQGTGRVMHANFRLPPESGTLVLSRYLSNALQIVDYLTYQNVTANHSYGDLPDGQPFHRQSLYWATAGGTNSAVQPDVTVWINEWMAENTSVLLDPATGKYEDWFELFNPTATDAELGGYYLSDTLSNPLQFQIPPGFKVPAGGYLLVWADGKSSANTNSVDLHASFKLDKAGEAIGLFTPAGLVVDAVSFGAQSANTSEGRIPDGGGLRLFLSSSSPRGVNVPPPAQTPPVLGSLTWVAPGTLGITFQTWPGHVYQVEYKADLSSSGWNPLGAAQLAAAGEITVQDPAAGAGQRFYRVRMVE